jgi:hypothetical protein
MASIDAQLRLLAPSKVSDDDKLVEYDALLLDRFLDILQDLHGGDIRETVGILNSMLCPFFSFIFNVFLYHENMLVLLLQLQISCAPL